MLFFLFGSLTLLFYYLEYPMMEFVCRSATFPLLAYHYFSSTTKPYSRLAVAYLLLAYLGEVIFLMEITYMDSLIMSVYVVIYLLLTYSFYLYAKKSRFNFKSALYALAGVVIIGVVMVNMIHFLPFNEVQNAFVNSIYSLVQVVFTGLAIYNYMNTHSSVTFYIAMVTLSNVVLDIFAVLISLMTGQKEYGMVVLFLQFTTYYLTVRYFMVNQASKQRNIIHE